MISMTLNYAKISMNYTLAQLNWLKNQVFQWAPYKNRVQQLVQAIHFDNFMFLPEELRLHVTKCVILPRDQINLLITCKALYALKLDVKVKLYEETFALAIKTGNNKAIFKIIDECPDYKTKLFEFDSRSEGKLTISLMDWASMNGNVEMVKALLADPEIDPSANDNSAVLWAAKKGHVKVIIALTNNEKIGLTVDYTSLKQQVNCNDIEVANLLSAHLDGCLLLKKFSLDLKELRLDLLSGSGAALRYPHMENNSICFHCIELEQEVELETIRLQVVKTSEIINDIVDLLKN